ncbi:MAG: pyridoxamine 5'-phosphate oxidase family protein [Acidobacteria bacterium]|nr:pyridoxamine 5'-phosphate oxidase family protein [Acidobacteriota bacterium]
MSWAQFKKSAPALARKAEQLFDKTGVVLLGTVRKDGSPRISPVEPLIVRGELYVGMLWKSLKAADLLRDPRCTVHSAIRERMATDGEFKLHGRVRYIEDPAERKRYGQALYKKIGWNPEGMKYHLFAVDVSSAGLFFNKSTYRVMKRWRAGEKTEQIKQTMEG